MHFSLGTKILAGIYAIVALGWLFFIFLGQHEAWIGDYYQIPFLVVHFGATYITWGAYFASRKNKSPINHVLLIFSIGLLTWSIGWLSNMLRFFIFDTAGYPSVGDYFYVMTWMMWIVGLVALLRVMRIQLDLSVLKTKLGIIGIPIILFSITIFLLIHADADRFSDLWSIVTLIDVFYSAADAVILTLVTIILLHADKYFGSKFQFIMGILFVAFGIVYVSDLAFSQAVSTDTYFNGHYTDFLFTTSIFTISVAMANLSQGAGAYIFRTPTDTRIYTERINRIWSSMKDMHLVLDEMFRELAGQIKVGKVAVFLRDEATLSYQQLHSLSEEKDVFDRKDPLLIHLHISPELVTFAGCMQKQIEVDSMGERERLEELAQSFMRHRLAVVMPVQKTPNFIAFIAIGPKVFGEPFSSQDLDKVRETASVVEKMVVNKYRYESAMARASLH